MCITYRFVVYSLSQHSVVVMAICCFSSLLSDLYDNLHQVFCLMQIIIVVLTGYKFYSAFPEKTHTDKHIHMFMDYIHYMCYNL